MSILALRHTKKKNNHSDIYPRLGQTKSRPAASWNPYLNQQVVWGNQALQRLLRNGVVQAKLKIGEPGDKYEQEADRVAEQVMRMQEPDIQRKPD